MSEKIPAKKAKPQKAARQRGDLISVDSTIDDIAKSALALARHTEELQRQKREADPASRSAPPRKKPGNSGESRS